MRSEGFLCFTEFLLSSFLNFLFTFLDNLSVGSDELVVNSGGTSGLGVEQPDEASELQNIVEGNESKDEPSALISYGKESENDPIGKPLLVVIFAI